jgi:metal-responsive CopG/Arc/MetJ family transcriptional regulator
MVIDLSLTDLELLDKKAKEETRSRSGYIQLILKQYLQKRNEKNEKN